MTQSKNSSTIPKSMRQKRILDVAASNPDASMETLATQIPSANTELIEQVLDEYGDPAEDSSEQSIETYDNLGSEDNGYPDPEDLTAKQLEILRTISAHSDATQRELAEILDISGSTVSTRANSIPGFEWTNRQAFAEAVINTDSSPTDNGSDPTISNTTECEASLDQLREHITVLERRIAELADTDEGQSRCFDAELTHKIVHACMNSDAISEEEELTILKRLLD